MGGDHDDDGDGDAPQVLYRNGEKGHGYDCYIVLHDDVAGTEISLKVRARLTENTVYVYPRTRATIKAQDAPMN